MLPFTVLILKRAAKRLLSLPARAQTPPPADAPTSSDAEPPAGSGEVERGLRSEEPAERRQRNARTDRDPPDAGVLDPGGSAGTAAPTVARAVAPVDVEIPVGQEVWLEFPPQHCRALAR